MGGTNKRDCLMLFGYIPMPATLEEIKQSVKERKMSWDLWSRHLSAGLDAGWILRDGIQYSLSQDVLAEGVTLAKKEIASWQKSLEYWQDHHERLPKILENRTAVDRMVRS